MYASRYRMLPNAIREFVEAAPSDMFLLGSKMSEIYRLSESSCQDCTLDCDRCFVESTRKIMVESGLF